MRCDILQRGVGTQRLEVGENDVTDMEARLSSRDFSLDPYFIRYPTTGLSGVVTTPSRVDVYVNNQLVRTLQVQPGAYELANLALPTGASDTRWCGAP